MGYAMFSTSIMYPIPVSIVDRYKTTYCIAFLSVGLQVSFTLQNFEIYIRTNVLILLS